MHFLLHNFDTGRSILKLIGHHITLTFWFKLKVTKSHLKRRCCMVIRYSKVVELLRLITSLLAQFGQGVVPQVNQSWQYEAALNCNKD